jgi:gamma-glutamyltranspeptidase/glutathione hydrolase
VFRELATQGVDVFYKGTLAQQIVNKVRSHPTNPGLLSESDLANYQPKERSALCFVYRSSKICGFPPPTSGGIALAQIFGILENTKIESYRPTQIDGGHWNVPVEAVHLYSEAARLAFADRALYVADSDFVPVPIAGLVDPDYLKQRASLIGERSMGVARPGIPPGVAAQGEDKSPELPSTSHISVVDRFGNALSMTASVEDAYGSRQMVRGFMLNNHLTDFSFASVDKAGRPIANRVQPGKRPRSSMSPVLVFDRSGKELRMSVGSPGGPAIIHFVGKVLLGTLDWGLNVQEAIDLPNFGSLNGPTILELGRVSDELIEGLRKRGHEVQVMEVTSGLQAIERAPGGWFGGADPRREGIAEGE